jgi:TonB-dependent receptor
MFARLIRLHPFHYNSSSGSRRTAHLACVLTLLLSAQRAAAQTTEGASTGEPVPAAGDDVLMMEAFGVEAEAVKGSSGDLGKMRQKADVSIDFLSNEQIAKFSAGDAAEALIRIPGVSVANGQFAVIRGLSDRFLSTSVNGLKLPSPDPEKQAFQMDLLPASAIGSIIVSKTYGPELWGESGGGNIDVTTNALPESNFVKVSVGTKFNSNALDGGLDYDVNGRGERFGFGASYRPGEGEAPSDFQYVPTHEKSLPLGTDVSFELGRIFNIGDNKLGWRFAAENESSIKTRSGTRQKFVPTPPNPSTTPPTPGGIEDLEAPDSLLAFTKNHYDESETESLTSFNTTLAFDFAQGHQLKFDAIYVQSGIDTSYLSRNASRLSDTLVIEPDPIPENSTLDQYLWLLGNEYYRERNLASFQFSGRHEWNELAGLRATWALQSAEASQKDSPFIETRFATPLTDPFAGYELPGNTAAPTALTMSWLDNVEKQRAGRIDFVLPRELFAERESELKFGIATDRSNRTVNGTTLFLATNADFQNSDYNDLYEDFINSGNFNPAGSGAYPAEAEATRDIDAAYLGTSLALTKRLKLIGGARLESSELSSSGGARWNQLVTNNFYSTSTLGFPFTYGELLGTADLPGAVFATPTATAPFIPVSANQKSDDVLPAVGMVFEPTKQTAIRLAYSQTIGRPSMREISPFINKSIDTQSLVIGNPGLTSSTVDNYDLRVEWNPSPRDGVAFSIFYKQIVDAIEKVSVQTSEGDTETWINNPNTAELKGVEFEFRHGLGRWSEVLEEFSLNGNFTYIDAEVEEHPVAILASQSEFVDPTRLKTTRRLYDQPEYLANADITWRRERWGTSITFAANAISDVLIASGLANGIGSEFAGVDLYQRAYVRYDLIFVQRLNKTFTFKASVKNLFDPVLGTIYDREALGRVVERNSYHAGRSFSFSISAAF